MGYARFWPCRPNPAIGPVLNREKGRLAAPPKFHSNSACFFDQADPKAWVKIRNAICPLIDSPGPNAHCSTPEHHTFRSALSGATRSTGTIPVVSSTEPHWGPRGEIFVPPGFHRGSTREFPGAKKPRGLKKIGFWMDSTVKFGFCAPGPLMA